MQLQITQNKIWSTHPWTYMTQQPQGKMQGKQKLYIENMNKIISTFGITLSAVLTQRANFLIHYYFVLSTDDKSRMFRSWIKSTIIFQELKNRSCINKNN